LAIFFCYIPFIKGKKNILKHLAHKENAFFEFSLFFDSNRKLIGQLYKYKEKNKNKKKPITKRGNTNECKRRKKEKKTIKKPNTKANKTR